MRHEASREGPHPRRIESFFLGGDGLEVLEDFGRHGGGRRKNNLKVLGQPGLWYSLDSVSVDVAEDRERGKWRVED